MISAVNGRKRALLTKSALEWHNKRCTAQSTLCVCNKKGKTELKAMCDFKKKKKKNFFFFFFSIAILGSRYDTRIAGPSIAMHRCIDASLRPYHRVASMLIKLINLYTNFSTLLPNVTALWINGVSLNSLAHTFFYRTLRPNK